MDIFKYNPSGAPTELESGEIINNLTNKMWVERYRDHGEFKLEAPIATGIKDKLPLGSIIGHTDTYEIMIVDDHSIKENTEEDPIIVVTGRTFSSYLEERIVGVGLARGSQVISPYIRPANSSWLQITNLINDHLTSTVGGSLASDILDGVVVDDAVSAFAIDVVDRTIQPGTVWERVKELLAIDDLGIRTIRKNAFLGGPSLTDTVIQIYNGANVKDSVRFSWFSNDLDRNEYLFTQRTHKNAALVVGQYIWKVVTTAPTKYARRFMIVDAKDIDGQFTEAPTGEALAYTAAAMIVRGQEAIKNQNQITIVQADVSEGSRYRYRHDYNMGDIVSVDGNYDQTAVMRVVEFAEIEDENGMSGHPTLEILRT